MSREKSTTQWTIDALNLRHRKNELKIPKVQRELVWTKSQKQLLIDSLIKDYDIPKFYMRKLDSSVYDVIDGQQRINAIIEFMNDEYPTMVDSGYLEKESLSQKKWSELSTDFQIEFKSRSLDVVILRDYTDEEAEEAFLRLQNGTPLKAPEKRRAIQGNMRSVVEELSHHSIFDYCGFPDTHFANEDMIAKIFAIMFSGGPASISSQALTNMYKHHADISMTDTVPKLTKQSLNFLVKAFKAAGNPKLKKYAVIDLCFISSRMLETYDLRQYPEQFAEAYFKFQDERVQNAEKPESEQDPELVAYSNCARGDSLDYIKFRQDLLRQYILDQMPYLSTKDSTRGFTQDQRMVIFHRDKGICQVCGKKCTEDSFHADHITPWSKGGKTQTSNGQTLCSACNKAKSNKTENQD